MSSSVPATPRGRSAPRLDRRAAKPAGWALGAFAGISACAPPVFAHHSEAAFDTDAVIAIRGTIEQFVWRNPHVYIQLSTETATGASVAWEIETGSTPILLRSGWTAESLKPGEVVTIRAHPARSPGRNYAMLVTARKEDGTVLTQSPADTTAVAASSMAGVWRGREESIWPLFEQWGSLRLTEKAQAAQASYEPIRDDPEMQCIAPPTPAMLVAAVLYLAEIELLEDRILMRSEFFDAERTIHMDGRGHPANGERTMQGHSIGRWEGDTLVVDTALFTEHRTANGEGVPSGTQRHVVERFKLSDDRTRLLIDFRVEDPEYLVDPFSASLEWQYAPELRLYRYNCDPEVSRRYTLQ
jgi:hypothetical protein